MSSWPLTQNPRQHYYKSRQGSILGIVLHVTAGAEDTDMVGVDGSAESTLRYGQTTTRAASWHGIVDSDSVIDCLPDDYTAFHVRGFNSRTLGLEIANIDAKWSGKPQKWVDATLLNAARWCAPRVQRYGLPMQLCTKSEVERAIAHGRPFGFTFHSYLDPARRIDPGRDFPWQRFSEMVDRLNRPAAKAEPKPEDDIMASIDELRELLRHELSENANTTVDRLLRHKLGEPNRRGVRYTFEQYVTATNRKVSAALANDDSLRALVRSTADRGGTPDEIADAVVTALHDAAAVEAEPEQPEPDKASDG